LALAGEQLVLPAQGRQLGLLLAVLLLQATQVVEGTVELGTQAFLGQARLVQALLQQQPLAGLGRLGPLQTPGQQGQRHGAEKQAEQQVGRFEDEGKRHGAGSLSDWKCPAVYPRGIQGLRRCSRRSASWQPWAAASSSQWRACSGSQWRGWQ